MNQAQSTTTQMMVTAMAFWISQYNNDIVLHEVHYDNHIHHTYKWFEVTVWNGEYLTSITILFLTIPNNSNFKITILSELRLITISEILSIQKRYKHTAMILAWLVTSTHCWMHGCVWRGGWGMGDGKAQRLLKVYISNTLLTSAIVTKCL